jgi:hypothetical protein
MVEHNPRAMDRFWHFISMVSQQNFEKSQNCFTNSRTDQASPIKTEMDQFSEAFSDNHSPDFE